MRANKKELQELVDFDYVVKRNLVAAYTNVEKHLRFLLSQPEMTKEILYLFMTILMSFAIYPGLTSVVARQVYP